MTTSRQQSEDGVSLEPIRQSIRSLCASDQFTWEKSWEAVLADARTGRLGLIRPEVFAETLELNGIRLTRRAFDDLVAAFQLPNGAVQASKFLQWIDLSRPRDHVDPELAFARLPQPYRRIQKVLELDILERAWELITTKSVRYKAELAAALSARQGHPGDPASLGELAIEVDDFDDAKKRCCKRPDRAIALPIETRGGEVVAMRMHRSQPLALILTMTSSCPATDDVGTQENATQGTSSTILPDLQLHVVTMDARAASTPICSTRLELEKLPLDRDPITLTSVSVRDVSDFEGNLSDADESHRSRVVVHLCRYQQGQDSSSSSSSQSIVLVYEFWRSMGGTLSGRLIASSSFVDPTDGVTAITLCHWGERVLVATSKLETSVFRLPSALDPDTESVELQGCPLVFRTTTPTPVARAFFLRAPVTTRPTEPTVADLLSIDLYAVALVTDDTIHKYWLPPRGDASATPTTARPPISWRQFTPIVSVSMDPTTRFLGVGLEDGAVVLWDLLENRDFAILAPPTTPVDAGPVDYHVVYQQRFVVTLAFKSQQLVFYDLTDRMCPRQVRLVLPPPPSQSTSEAAAPPVTFTSLSLDVGQVDVPIVAVGCSTGYAMLYDLRCGRAIGSYRIPKTTTGTTTPLSHSTMSCHGVLVLPPRATESRDDPVVVNVFTWRTLLSSISPELEQIARGHRLEVTDVSLKRAFLSTVDFNGGRPSSLSLGSKPTLMSIVRQSAGLPASSNQSSHSVIPSTANQTLSQAKFPTSNTDSRASLGTPQSREASTADASLALPALSAIRVCSYLPDLATEQERLRHEELAKISSDRDAKVHRRRQELLKILTTTSW